MALIWCTGHIHAVLVKVLFILVNLQLHGIVLAGDNKDVDHQRISKSGLQMTEGRYGIPVPIDNLFSQISPLPPDDLECTNGSELTEMDMCLTQAQLGLFDTVQPQTPAPPTKAPTTGKKRKRRQASANGFSLWENGVIPYVFNSTFPALDREAIVSAMREWEKGSCVRFRPANREDVDMIVFRDGKRCSTNIGRITGEQAVTLAKTCRSKRILIHELGHVIGLIHEHQRHDRDNYVKVMLENVRNRSQERYQFMKLLTGSITDIAVKYDYTSVMHYGKNYFARSPSLITLRTIDSRFQDVIGRAEKPSFYDLETVNRLYLCSASCPRSLHCSEHCYMDKMCMCRCKAGYEKAYFGGPGPYRNNLPDSTCDFFATRGECEGNIKDTVRPLCAKSCGLHQYKFNTPAAASSAGLAAPPPIPVAASSGRSGAPFDPLPGGNQNGNFIQQTKRELQQNQIQIQDQGLRLRRQMRQQQQQQRLINLPGTSPFANDRYRGRGEITSNSLISPTSPSASMVWSRANSIDRIGGIDRVGGFNNNNYNENNRINSIFGRNSLNSVNDIQFLRGGAAGSFGRFSPKLGFLAGGDGRGQQTRSSLSAQQQRLRAAYLQRQAAFSSSEPSRLRSLVVGRSNGRTARLLLPTQTASLGSSRRSPALSPASSISASQRLRLLRQQRQDQARLLARPGFASRDDLGISNQGRSLNSRLTRGGAPDWVDSTRSRQQQQSNQLQQRRQRGPYEPRQQEYNVRGGSIPNNNGGGAAVINNRVTSATQSRETGPVIDARTLGRSSQTRGSWQDIARGRQTLSQSEYIGGGRNVGGDFLVNSNSGNINSSNSNTIRGGGRVSVDGRGVDSNRWRKFSRESRLVDQNVPMTLEVDRIPGPLPLDGFNSGSDRRRGFENARGNSSRPNGISQVSVYQPPNSGVWTERPQWSQPSEVIYRNQDGVQPQSNNQNHQNNANTFDYSASQGEVLGIGARGPTGELNPVGLPPPAPPPASTIKNTNTEPKMNVSQNNELELLKPKANSANTADVGTPGSKSLHGRLENYGMSNDKANFSENRSMGNHNKNSAIQKINTLINDTKNTITENEARESMGVIDRMISVLSQALPKHKLHEMNLHSNQGQSNPSEIIQTSHPQQQQQQQQYQQPPMQLNQYQSLTDPFADNDGFNDNSNPPLFAGNVKAPAVDGFTQLHTSSTMPPSPQEMGSIPQSTPLVDGLLQRSDSAYVQFVGINQNTDAMQHGNSGTKTSTLGPGATAPVSLSNAFDLFSQQSFEEQPSPPASPVGLNINAQPELRKSGNVINTQLGLTGEFIANSANSNKNNVINENNRPQTEVDVFGRQLSPFGSRFSYSFTDSTSNLFSFP